MTESKSLHWIDWTIIVAYICFSLGVGIYFSKRAASSTEYLRAIFDSRGGNIPDFSNEEQLNKWIFEPPDCYCNNEYIPKFFGFI